MGRNLKLKEGRLWIFLQLVEVKLMISPQWCLLISKFEVFNILLLWYLQGRCSCRTKSRSCECWWKSPEGCTESLLWKHVSSEICKFMICSSFVTAIEERSIRLSLTDGQWPVNDRALFFAHVVNPCIAVLFVITYGVIGYSSMG